MNTDTDSNGEFCELAEDNEIDDRWVLDDANADGSHWMMAMIAGKVIEAPGPMRVKIAYPGRQMDINFSSLAVPLFSTRAVELLKSLCARDMQVIPADVEGVSDSFHAVNLLRHLDCLDEELSVFAKPKRDGSRDVRKLGIDSTRVGEASAFRVQRWVIPFVIHRRVRDLFEKNGITGATYSRFNRDK